MSMSDKWHGDLVERFTLMADNRDEQPIDAPHFRMWCRLAAEEISRLRACVRVNGLRAGHSHEEIDRVLK